METTQKVGMAVGMGTLFAVGTAAGAGLCALANKVHYLSLVKSSLPIAITGGLSAAFLACLHQWDVCEDDVKLLTSIALIAATIWASPHLTKYLPIEADRLSYLESAVLTAPGIGVIGTSISGYKFVSDAFTQLKTRKPFAGEAEKPQ